MFHLDCVYILQTTRFLLVVFPFIDGKPKTFRTSLLKLAEAVTSIGGLVTLSTIVVHILIWGSRNFYLLSSMTRDKAINFHMRSLETNMRRVRFSNGRKHSSKTEKIHTRVVILVVEY